MQFTEVTYLSAVCSALPRLFGLLFLCCMTATPGKLMAGKLLAQDLERGKPIQIKSTLNQLLGEQEAARYTKILKPDKRITWEVYLPDNNTNEPPGVLVYVSPVNRGRLRGAWRSVMDRYNLVFIGANKSGNRIPVNRRMVMALMGLKALEPHLLIDSSRISVSGYSGGGRVASMLAGQYPEVFTGALYICGVNFWQESLDPRVEQLVKNRFVFFTGSKDFNRDETQNVYRQYLHAGAEHSKLMIVPGMGHERPDEANMDEAMEFIYGPAEAEEGISEKGDKS